MVDFNKLLIELREKKALAKQEKGKNIMAVVTPGSQNRKSDGEQSSSTDAKRKASEGRVVDLFAEKDLPAGEKRKLDKDEDAWTFAAPPPAGRYSIKVFPAKEPCKIVPRDRENPDNGEVYYSLAMECKVLDKDLSTQLATVFPYVNTIIGRGKNISTAAGLIGKLGYKIPDEADDLTIAKMALKAIQAEKVVEVELDWSGQYKDSKGDYKSAWKSMNEFPRDEDSNPMHIARYKTKDGEYDVTARLEIRHWYSKGEASITPKGRASGGGSGSTDVLRPIKLTEIVSEPVQAQTVQAQSAPASNKIVESKQADSDLLMLLEGE